MKLNLNNNELVSVMLAIDNYLEYTDDKMVLASLKSLLHKINNNVTIVNNTVDDLGIKLRQQLNEIEELMDGE